MLWINEEKMTEFFGRWLETDLHQVRREHYLLRTAGTAWEAAMNSNADLLLTLKKKATGNPVVFSLLRLRSHTETVIAVVAVQAQLFATSQADPVCARDLAAAVAGVRIEEPCLFRQANGGFLDLKHLLRAAGLVIAKGLRPEPGFNTSRTDFPFFRL